MCGNVVRERFRLQRGGMIGSTTRDSKRPDLEPDI